MGTVPAFPHGMPLTRADLEAMPDDGHRYELVDGTLIMSPSPRPLHQRIVARLVIALTMNCPAHLEVLPAPVDVVLADNTVLIPDVVVGRRSDFTTSHLAGIPELAIEVLSPSTRLVDLELKRARLQEAGCPNYWLIDPELPELRCLALRGGVYSQVLTAVGDEIIEVSAPFTVSLSPGQLVAPYGR
ncbi:Uma2 family endonuclease [Kutzneria viridogrisea]|uniref:Uma2 family endonuclease n=1 Tax=Kutzneria viridogrisea TaxID=47990 RepID=UPI0031FA3A56